MIVRDNIADGKYSSKIPSFVKTPVDEEKMTVRQAREHSEAQKEAARLRRIDQWEDEQRLRILFQADLEEEHGVRNHPKADRVFELAWEHGHSSGYEEVVSCYADFVELIK